MAKSDAPVPVPDRGPLRLRLHTGTAEGPLVWSVWLDGRLEDLWAVERVDYTLPPTFPNNVRTIIDRASGFAMRESGPASFLLKAKAVRRDRSEAHLQYSVEVREGKSGSDRSRLTTTPRRQPAFRR